MVEKGNAVPWEGMAGNLGELKEHMAVLSHDFTGYRVLVIGGTRGTGHTIARSFRDSGANVTVTGTMMLRELYDGDLAGMDYEMVNLARQDSINHLTRSTHDIDVLVLAAGCNLPHGLPASERAFVTEAVRSGVLGPLFLTTRLRLKLGQSLVPGGGCVINTSAVAHWLELTADPDDVVDDLAMATARAAHNWAGIGVRVNSVIEPVSSFVPRQFGYSQDPRPVAHRADVGGHDTLVRTSPPSVAESVAAMAMFLATPDATRLTGQTLHLS